METEVLHVRFDVVEVCGGRRCRNYAMNRANVGRERGLSGGGDGWIRKPSHFWKVGRGSECTNEFLQEAAERFFLSLTTTASVA